MTQIGDMTDRASMLGRGQAAKSSHIGDWISHRFLANCTSTKETHQWVRRRGRGAVVSSCSRRHDRPKVRQISVAPGGQRCLQGSQNY